jgi:hypothetical protein
MTSAGVQGGRPLAGSMTPRSGPPLRPHPSPSAADPYQRTRGFPRTLLNLCTIGSWVSGLSLGLAKSVAAVLGRR